MTRLSNIIGNMETQVEESMGDLIDNRDYASEIGSYTEGWVPQSKRDLAECLMQDTDLGDRKEELPENPTVWEIIQANIMEQLKSAGMIKFQELKDEHEERAQELEAAGYEVEFNRSNRKYQVMLLDINEIDEPSLLKGDFASEYEAVKWWAERPEGEE